MDTAVQALYGKRYTLVAGLSAAVRVVRGSCLPARHANL